MSRRPTYTVAMRDWSVPLGEWIWTCVGGTMPPEAALQWRELVEVAPGVVRWQPHSRPEMRIIQRAEGG
jgi:hypothetical protein